MPRSEYRYTISTNNLRKAVVQGLNLMIELLGHAWRDCNDESEEQAAAELINQLESYRHDYFYCDAACEPDDDVPEESVEITE